MPHQHEQFLLPGESLVHGEFLVSQDGRFRLYLEDDGNLVAYSYQSDRGIQRFFATDIHDRGPFGQPIPVRNPGDVRLELTSRFVSPYGNVEAIMLTNSAGEVYWAPAFALTLSSAFENVMFVVQDDGNLVHYVNERTTQKAGPSWASGTDGDFRQPIAIPPNQPVVEVPPPGTLILNPQVGNTVIENKSGGPAAARDSNKVVSIPPGQSVSVSHSDAIDVSTRTYAFTDLKAPDGTKPYQSEDATVRVPGTQNRVEILPNGALALTGFFDRFGVPHLKNMKLASFTQGREGSKANSSDSLARQGRQLRNALEL